MNRFGIYQIYAQNAYIQEKKNVMYSNHHQWIDA